MMITISESFPFPCKSFTADFLKSFLYKYQSDYRISESNCYICYQKKGTYASTISHYKKSDYGEHFNNLYGTQSLQSYHYW